MPVFDCAIPCAESSAEKSEFDTDAAAAYTRSQTLEAGKFAVFIGGKRIPVREQLRPRFLLASLSHCRLRGALSSVPRPTS